MNVQKYFLWMLPYILNRYPYIYDIEYDSKTQYIRGQKIQTWYITVNYDAAGITQTKLFTKYNNFLYNWLRPQNPQYFDKMIADIRKIAAEVNRMEEYPDQQGIIQLFERQY